MKVGAMVEDRIYGGDTRFRLGIIKQVTLDGCVLVRWLVGEQLGLNWYYPDNLEVICQ